MMLAHLRKFARLGLILATAILPMTVADATQVSNLDLETMSEEFMENQEIPTDTYFQADTPIAEKYNKRMRDVIIDMIRLEYI